MLKRKSLSVKEKAKIIWKLESGVSNASLCKEFAISHSTISTIWKNRDKIKKTFENDSFNVKKIRNSQHQDIDDCLLQWFKSQRVLNISINGPILQSKAQEFARILGKRFQPDASWVQRFRKRHDIVFSKSCGESSHVLPGIKKEWFNVNQIRNNQHQDIDECLLQWLKSQHHLNVTINGPILQSKAKEFAKLLDKHFQPDVTFVQEFCNRHHIEFNQISNEKSRTLLGVKKEITIPKSASLTENFISSSIKDVEYSVNENKESILGRPSVGEALSAISLLRSFFMINETTNTDNSKALCLLEREIEKNYYTKLNPLKRKRKIVRTLEQYS